MQSSKQFLLLSLLAALGVAHYSNLYSRDADPLLNDEDLSFLEAREAEAEANAWAYPDPEADADADAEAEAAAEDYNDKLGLLQARGFLDDDYQPNLLYMRGLLDGDDDFGRPIFIREPADRKNSAPPPAPAKKVAAPARQNSAPTTKSDFKGAHAAIHKQHMSSVVGDLMLQHHKEEGKKTDAKGDKALKSMERFHDTADAAREAAHNALLKGNQDAFKSMRAKANWRQAAGDAMFNKGMGYYNDRDRLEETNKKMTSKKGGVKWLQRRGQAVWNL